MVESEILNPEQWEEHLKKTNIPDNYINFLLQKIEAERSAKISIVFNSNIHGTRYDIVDEHYANKQKVSVFSKKDYLKKGQRVLKEMG